MTDPSELENGTTIYFRIGTGSVLKGEIVGREELQKQHAFTDYDESCNLARVEIDRETRHSDDSVPDHMAPKEYQPADNDSFFRDAYTIDAEEQHYIVQQKSLVAVLD